MNPERRIHVQWKEKSAEKSAGSFRIKLNMQAYDKVGLLAEISSVLSQLEANIMDVNLESEKDKMVNGFFTIAVKDIDHLDEVIVKLKKIDAIQKISRE
jgi:GTP pyrophosphokinase